MTKTKSCGMNDIYSVFAALKLRASYGIKVRWTRKGQSFIATGADGSKVRWTL